MASDSANGAVDEELAQTAWDLEPLVAGEGAEGVERRLGEALERAQAFAQIYAGKLGELDSHALRTAMRELAAIQYLAGRAGPYGGLRFPGDHASPQHRGPATLATLRAT